MQILKTNWLRAILLTALSITGLYLVADAMHNNNKVQAIKSPKSLVNPQWFIYTKDPNSLDFATEKLNPANYTPTNSTDQHTRPCLSNGEFCSIYAETVMNGSQQEPNLSSGQAVRSELDTYQNGDGESHLQYIDEKA